MFSLHIMSALWWYTVKIYTTSNKSFRLVIGWETLSRVHHFIDWTI